MEKNTAQKFTTDDEVEDLNAVIIDSCDQEDVDAVRNYLTNLNAPEDLVELVEDYVRESHELQMSFSRGKSIRVVDMGKKLQVKLSEVFGFDPEDYL